MNTNTTAILDAFAARYSGPQDWLCASTPEAMAQEWAAEGFDADAAAWWAAGCFDAQRAAELRTANVADDPETMHLGVCPEHLATLKIDGLQVGYLHSDGGMSTEQVVEVYRGSLS